MFFVEEGSATWCAVLEWAKGRIEELRDMLEHQDSPGARGGIAVLRELVDLPDAGRKLPVPPTVPYVVPDRRERTR